MTHNTQRESAKIYQFPVGGRASALGRRDGQHKATDTRSTRFATVDCGSGWYHDAAIKEAELVRKS